MAEEILGYYGVDRPPKPHLTVPTATAQLTQHMLHVCTYIYTPPHAAPKAFVSMMQHFGAGIVLSAVATELLPAMSSQVHTSRVK